MSLPYKAEVKHEQDGYGRASNQRPYWMVEPQVFAWLGNFRRLVVRYERRVDNYLGLVHLGCIVILLRRLPNKL